MLSLLRLRGPIRGASRLSTGVATSAATAGQFLIVSLLAILLTSFSWISGFVGLGIGTACLIPLVWLVPKEKRNDNDSSPVREKQAWKADVKRLASNPVFYLLYWRFFICGYTTSGVIETQLLAYASFCGFALIPSATAYFRCCLRRGRLFYGARHGQFGG